ncbi:hypothetical protein [uncultured Parabacteroides sp.]|uniref:hypothetical protein n=1 Tax=uncultured Parabacteroides sp. TaxID=512312 RepID=UPI0026117388|nr:hypothetical protein [uncultured Parabacteroides sp.]
MILITSGAYCSPALMSEFGMQPPCMLPIQNRRLYVHQLQNLPSNELIVISLPSDYVLSEFDKEFFLRNDINIVPVPKELSLGASIVYVLNFVSRYDEPLRILHGDTLMKSIPNGYDNIVVSTVVDDYSWDYWDKTQQKAIVGYFSFSSQSLLIRSITVCGNKFIDGVRLYDKTIKLESIEIKDWLDFGLSNTYYRSKSTLTTERTFNDLKITKYSVTKRSNDTRKILAEANWINNIPNKLRHYVPTLWDYGISLEGKGYYEIEYFYLNSLADLYVFGRNSENIWKRIIDSCAEYICDESGIVPCDTTEIAENCVSLYGKKTYDRLVKYCTGKEIDMNTPFFINGENTPSLNEILEDISMPLQSPSPQFVSLMHGDFCFSNILYDFISCSIKVIDPRGLDTNGNETIYGDFRYDVAKLAHSVLGLYDLIIGGFFNYNEKGKYDISLTFPEDIVHGNIQRYFKLKRFAGYTLAQLKTYPIMIHLFLSMLPLHSDNPLRQKAMLANALRLYSEYKKSN